MFTLDQRKLLVGMGAALAAPSMNAVAASSELRKWMPPIRVIREVVLPSLL